MRMAICIVFLVMLSACAGEKLRECPDGWYIDRTPSVREGIFTSSGDNEYFMKDGVRREISEFDVEWVEQNCGLEPRILA
jgi:hypothetical protein